MHRFWTQFSKPLLETVKPRRIMQIGAGSGLNTRHILDYCRHADARADIIEPNNVGAELRDVLAIYPDAHDFHPLKSLEAIPDLNPPDVLFLAECRNWKAVLNTLTQICAHARDKGAVEPIMLVHNCAWPYARRDMYTAVEAASPDHRHAYAYKGMLPGRSELTDDGLNRQFANALHEGGPENGVLTAVEDFSKAWLTPLALSILPFFHGMGIVIPEKRRTPGLDTLLKNFFSADTMLEVAKALEQQTMFILAESEQRDAALIRRTDTLRRARDLFATQSAQIAALEEEKKATDTPKS